MPYATYLSRLQRALGDLAKQDKESASYLEIEQNIRAQYRSDNVTHGPRYRDHILDALMREARSRRVIMDVASGSARVLMTPAGLLFYKELGTIPLYDADHPRMRYMTIRKLRGHSRVLRDVIGEIGRIFAEFRPDHVPREDGSDLPDAIQDVRNDIDHLKAQNTELELELMFEEGDKQRLLQRLSLVD